MKRGAHRVLHAPAEAVKHLLVVAAAAINLVGCVKANYYTGYLRDTCLCTSRQLCTAGQSSFTLRPIDGVGAGYILLSRDATVDQSLSGIEYRCTYTIVAPPAMAVYLRVNSVNIPMTSAKDIRMTGMQERTGGGCNVAALQIYDGNMTTDVSKQFIGMCGSALPTEVMFISTSNEMTLYYHETVFVQHDEPISFNLTFTYIAIRKSGCTVKEFSCRSNSHCIASSLLCDGVPNCPDDSDESADFDSCGRFLPSSNPFVGTTVGVSLFLFFGLLLCVAAAKVKKQRLNGSSSGLQTLRGTTSTDSAAVSCLPENDSSENQFMTTSHQRTDENRTTADSAIIQYPSHAQTFQPLILVAGSRHVTVVAMAPPQCPDQPARCTPPPPYDSLFPETASQIEDMTSS